MTRPSLDGPPCDEALTNPKFSESVTLGQQSRLTMLRSMATSHIGLIGEGEHSRLLVPDWIGI